MKERPDTPQSITGCASAKSAMRACHCYTMTGCFAEMTGRMYAWSPVTSREDLERPSCDRTRTVHLNRTLHSIWCNTLGYTALASTDRTHNPMFGHCESSVWSQKISDNHLLYFTNFSTLAQMCQPPSVSPCACVLAYFHKHFQGC